MKEYRSDAFVSNALSELIEDLGVKDETDSNYLEALFREKGIQVGVHEIAHLLGLPISINLEIGEKNIQSEGLARTDANGRGIEGVIAQVRIPSYLPWYGTSELRNYPIEVIIGPDFQDQLATLIAILVHELSHILLHSMRARYCEDEVHTDLAGLVLGLTSAVEKGRKIIRTENRADGIHTLTTTYGYLSDGQFHRARKEIARILEDNKTRDYGAEAEILELDRLCNIAEQQVDRFLNGLNKVDRFPKKRMAEKDASRLVAFHQPDYLDSIRLVLRDSRTHIGQATSFFQPKRHFTKKRKEDLIGIQDITRTHAAHVISSSAKLKADIDIISRGMKFRAKYV